MDSVWGDGLVATRLRGAQGGVCHVEGELLAGLLLGLEELLVLAGGETGGGLLALEVGGDGCRVGGGGGAI